MKISLIVEADYSNLHDQTRMRRKPLEDQLIMLAKRVENDYKNRNSEQNKYDLFYKLYVVDEGSKPGGQRTDTATRKVLNQMQLMEDHKKDA